MRRQLLVILLAFAYAGCFTAIKAGLVFAPPLLFAGLRALVAGLALLLLLAVRREPLLPARGSWRWVIALALVSTTLALGAMFLSPGHTGAGIASVLGNLQPVAIVALAAPLLGEPITLSKATALALGFAGALLVSSAALSSADSSDVFGPVLALATSLSVAMGNVLAKRMGAQPRLIAIAGWQLLLGSVPLIVASALLERGASVRWEVPFIVVLLFLALVGTALPTPLWYWLVQGDEVGRLTLFLFLVPVLGLALGAVVFREPVSAPEALGTGVILAGIVVAVRGGVPAGAVAAARAVEDRWLSLPCGCPSLCCLPAGELAQPAQASGADPRGW